MNETNWNKIQGTLWITYGTCLAIFWVIHIIIPNNPYIKLLTGFFVGATLSVSIMEGINKLYQIT